MKSNKFVLAIVMLIVVAVIVSIKATINENNDKHYLTEWYDNLNQICIGTGKIDEYENTNSIEALKKNYEKGFRIFEIDLSLTSDSKIVLKKDWTTFSGQDSLNINTEGTNIPTLEEFKNVKIYEKYTPATMEDIISAMDEYKDMYVVMNISKTESKDVIELYSELIREFKTSGKFNYLNRVIVQLYNQNMLDSIESVYHFRNYMYKIDNSDAENIDDIINFCNRNAIKLVSINWYLIETMENLQNKINENKINDYIYDVNDTETARKYIKNGARGIFTNSYITEDITSNNSQGVDNENKE